MHKGVEGSWTWGSDGVDGETPAAIEGTLRAGLLKNRSKKKNSARQRGRSRRHLSVSSKSVMPAFPDFNA